VIERKVQAGGPLFRFVKALFQQSIGEYLKDDCAHLSAAISYYAIFAMFPLLIFVFAIAGMVVQGDSVRDDIVDEVLDTIPLSEGEGEESVRDAVEGVGQTSGGALGLLALIGLAWSGSSLFGALRKGLNAAFDDVETKRPWVPQKAIDLALVVSVAVFFLASIAATAFLRIARSRSEDLGSLGEFVNDVGVLWDAASYAIPVAFSIIAFMALYCLVPSRLRSPLDVWPGALIGALAFQAVTLGFSIYLENFTNYDILMGSLGAAAGLLFWIFVNANIMLFGAEVAAEYPRVPARGYEQPVMEGIKPPLKERAWEAFRGLFVSKKKRDARAENEDEAAAGEPSAVAPTERDAPRA
jgi:membrane protein